MTKSIVQIAHGLYLAYNKGVLIDEPVEAWNKVPVIRTVFYSFGQYQTNLVEEYCAFTYPQLSSIACGPGNPAELFNVKKTSS